MKLGDDKLAMDFFGVDGGKADGGDQIGEFGDIAFAEVGDQSFRQLHPSFIAFGRVEESSPFPYEVTAVAAGEVFHSCGTSGWFSII